MIVDMMISTCNRARCRFGLRRDLVQHLLDEHGHDFRAWWPKLIEMELGPSYVLAIQGHTKGDSTPSDEAFNPWKQVAVLPMPWRF